MTSAGQNLTRGKANILYTYLLYLEAFRVKYIIRVFNKRIVKTFLHQSNFLNCSVQSFRVN